MNLLVLRSYWSPRYRGQWSILNSALNSFNHSLSCDSRLNPLYQKYTFWRALAFYPHVFFFFFYYIHFLINTEISQTQVLDLFHILTYFYRDTTPSSQFKYTYTLIKSNCFDPSLTYFSECILIPQYTECVIYSIFTHKYPVDVPELKLPSLLFVKCFYTLINE